VVNAAVTPAGTPDAVRLTLPLKPFRSVTVMSIRLSALLDPSRRVRLPTEGEIVKFGTGLVIAAPWVPATIERRRATQIAVSNLSWEGVRMEFEFLRWIERAMVSFQF